MAAIPYCLMILFILYQPVLYSVTLASHPPPSNHHKSIILHQINQLAYRGDINTLKSYWTSHNDTITTALGSEERTPIHSALHGRHVSLSQQSLHLHGHHEDIISWLLVSGGVSADQGCPLYYAIHYRNMIALETLLTHAHMDKSSLCLTMVDSTGRTALHSAVKSKASGFARFFAKLRNQQSPPDPQVLQLLGLQPLQETEYYNFSAVDLNSVITHRDIELIMKHWPSLDISSIVDKDGNTLLHEAAYSGRVELIHFLAKRLELDTVNGFGLTPLQLALAGGHTAIADVLISYGETFNEVWSNTQRMFEVGQSIKKEGVCLESDQSCSKEETDLWSRYLTSGWVDDSGDVETFSGCDIISKTGLTEDEFRAMFYGHFRPVVLKGMISNWPAWENWTKHSLLNKYGGVEFTVSGVPYAELYYGQDAQTTRTTLRDFVQTFNETLSYPDYIFDGQILYHNTQLAQDVPFPPPSFPSLNVALKQLIIGPQRSGSPPHFHRHVLNALVYGVKQWYLWPPSHAYFDFRHVQDWFLDHNRPNTNSDSMVMECIQRPGDVLYVPENWGHAVVNIMDSIAVAFEFE